MSAELVLLLLFLFLAASLAAAYLWYRAHRGEPPAPDRETPEKASEERSETGRRAPPVIVMEAWAGSNPSIPIPDYGYPAYSIPFKAFPEWGAAVTAGGRGMSMALIVRRRRRRR